MRELEVKEKRKALLSRAWHIVEQAVELKLWDYSTGLTYLTAVKNAETLDAEKMVSEWEASIEKLAKEKK